MRYESVLSYAHQSVKFMIEIKDILTISFLNMCIAQLKEMEERYKNMAWMDIILRYAELELREAIHVYVNPEFYPENKTRIDEQYYSLVCEMKAHIQPADYLFLKSLFSNDDNDIVFFIRQAQMLEPENQRFLLMTTFLAPDAQEYPEAVIKHMHSIVKSSDSADVVEFAHLADIITTIFNSPSEVRSAEIAQFLNKTSLHDYARCSLLYHIVCRTPAPSGESLLDRIKIPGYEDKLEYILARMHVHYELREFRIAEKWLTKLDGNLWIGMWDLKLEWMYKRTHMLKEMEKEGKAILLLLNIVYSEGFRDSGSDYYYRAVADLAVYFVNSNQPEEADKVLSMIPHDMMRYLESLAGDGFLMKMAEKAMLEADFKKAKRFYLKAYVENSSPEFREKIKEKIRKLKGID